MCAWVAWGLAFPLAGVLLTTALQPRRLVCRESFSASLLRGERASIYPVLAYVLAKLPQLKKRAYVARFLMPVDIPPEFLHDEVVQVRQTHSSIRCPIFLCA